MIGGAFHLEGGRTVYLWRQPRPASRWIVVYGSAVELLRHGRPIAFAAGVLFGVLLALGALLSTPTSRSFAGLEGSAARASHLAEPARAIPTDGVLGPRPPAPTTADSRPRLSGPAVQADARATAIDELPAASEAFTTLPGPNPIGHHDDPSALVVRASPVARSLVVATGDRHGIDGERFADVMFCESSLRPDAIGDGGRAVGIAQFHVATWAASSRRYYGMELAPAMRLDPDIALLVAARKWIAEGPWAWSCAR